MPFLPPPTIGKRTAILAKDGLIEIRFPFSSDLIDIIKTLEGRRYHSQERLWTAPPSKANIKKLAGQYFELCPKLSAMVAPAIKEKDPAPTIIPGLKTELKPFQAEGVVAVDELFSGRALIGDDMGLGKTVQAIAWLQIHKKARPAVVLCPASIKEMWARKIGEWMTDERTVILSGKPGKASETKEKAVVGKGNPAGPIYILNYDIIGNKLVISYRDDGTKVKKEVAGTGWVDWLIENGIHAVVVDEGHYLKSGKKSARGVGGIKLMKAAEFCLVLSGTPIENRPAEFWPVLNALKPHLFRDFFKFGKRYCGAVNNGFGWSFKGATNLQELNAMLRETVMIRRLKKDVLKDLPPKQRVVVPLAIDDTCWKTYIEAEKEVACAESKFLAITKLIKLQQAAVRAKLKSALDWVADFLESDEKLIVFAHHHFVVDAIRHRFDKVTKIAEVTGRTVGSKQEQEDLFQNDPGCRLFIGSKSATEGLTLHAASNVAFFEFFETPGKMAQAEDRAHRIGQVDSVTSWFLIAAETIEEDNAALLDKKLQVLKAVLDDEIADETELITELLKAVIKRSEER